MNWKEKLKKQWNENPLQCIVIGAFAATAAAKVLDSVSAAQSRHAYAQQIKFKTGF